MILSPIQIIIIVFSLFALSLTTLYFRNEKISLTEYLLYAFVWLSIFIFALYPTILSRLAGYLGISRGVDVLVYSAVIILFFGFFKMHAKLERLDQENGRVIGEIALLRNNNNKIKKKQK